MFNSKNFSVMSYANGFTLWNYTTDDALSDVKEAGYFNETAPFARKGDMILVVASKNTNVEAAVVFVKEVSSDSVEVKDIIPSTEIPEEENN